MVVPLAWMWNASRLPGSYSVMDMGYVDSGGGSTEHAHMGTPVSDLVGPAGAPDVRMTLATRLEGKRYTVNGTSPGPLVSAVEGQLVEITLVNDNVKDGVTLHWHGLDVPNAEDGVAGVTQDAVLPGERHVYRWRAEHPGTYWYHSHQVSHTQVLRGLLGPLVITPRGATPAREATALIHSYAGKATVNGSASDVRVHATSGGQVRVRVINTDNGVSPVWASGSWKLLAIDGRDLHEPGAVTGKVLRLTAGARADLLVTAPARVSLGGSVAMLVGDGPPATDPQPSEVLDLLTYGTPSPLGFDPAKADREFRYSIGRRPGFVKGRPGLWWSINSHLFPDVPMFLVAEGDVVRMTIKNSSGEAHPMHLHGHHAVVLSRDGKKATGSPWWVDSLDVPSGHRFEIAFVADNPGIWMDHCHNLPHAQQGLVAHLMYAGVTEPFRVNDRNEPE